MISLGTRAIPKSNRQLPFNVEPLEGEIRIRASKGLTLSKRDAQQNAKDVPILFRDGTYTIKLDNTLPTNWLFLRGAP